MIELQQENLDIIYSLYKNSENILVKMALEGKRGYILVTESENPSFYLIKMGNFVNLIGLPPRGEEALRLRANLMMECADQFIIPENEAWEIWLEENLDCPYRKLNRYELKSEMEDLDIRVMDAYISALPEGFEIRHLGVREYEDALSEDWSDDFLKHYANVEEYLEKGLGYVIYHNDELVSGCSAYGFEEGYLEIEVITKMGYKRQGLGIAVLSMFLKKCMEMELYPRWDASRMHTVELAQRLGFTFVKQYRVYQIHGDII